MKVSSGQSLNLIINLRINNQHHWQIQGVPPVHAPSMGSSYFIFACISAKIDGCSHQWAGALSPMGNLGSATEHENVKNCFYNANLK